MTTSSSDLTFDLQAGSTTTSPVKRPGGQSGGRGGGPTKWIDPRSLLRASKCLGTSIFPLLVGTRNDHPPLPSPFYDHRSFKRDGVGMCADPTLRLSQGWRERREGDGTS